LKSLLGSREFVLTLLYQACKDDEKSEANKHKVHAEYFHSMCDGKGPTVSLFKLNNGNCIGGYTSAKWHTPPSSFLGTHTFDNSAIIFNLTDEVSYPIVKADKAIFCFRNNGPCFGDEELYVGENFFGDNQCKSFAGQHSYDIKTKN
jgi:hypothetical protein